MATPDELKQEGNRFYLERDFAKALDCYKRAIAQTPENPILWNNASAAEYQLKHFEASLLHARHALALAPDSAKAHVRAGKAFMGLKRFAEARVAFSTALSIEPDKEDTQIALVEAERAFVVQYYSPFNKSLENAQIEYIDPSRGKGVIAKREFKYGQPIFSETPLVSHRFMGEQEAIQSCSVCMQTRLSKDDMGTMGVLFERVYPSGPSPFLTCERCNAPYELYCSEACRVKAWKDYHSVYCPQSPAKVESHPISKLYKLCSANKRTNPLIIARAFAMTVSGLKQNTFPSVRESFQRFANFVASEEVEPGDEKEFACIEQGLGPENASLLGEVLSLQNFRLLGGAIMRNAQRINPVSDVHALIDTLAKTNAHELAQVLQLIGFKIPQLAGLRMSEPMRRLTISGSGLFEIGNTMNHSCMPSAVSMTGQTNYTLSVVAVRDIPRAGEVCISYIDSDQPKEKRQAALADLYYFACECEKCSSEK